MKDSDTAKLEKFIGRAIIAAVVVGGAIIAAIVGYFTGGTP